MTEDEARRLFSSGAVARLASADAAGKPHLVPVTFALPHPSTVVFAVDSKPKSTTALKRLENIRENSHVALLVDEYTDDWSQLWWVRADADATVLDSDDKRSRAGLDALINRYPQYRRNPPAGPVVVCQVSRWVGWAAR